MKTLLVILAVCSLTTAFVPRDRRAVNTEEEEQRLRDLRTAAPSATTSSTGKPKEICAPQTPCAWSTYRPVFKIIEANITNSYCICSPDTVCQVNEDDTAVNAYVYRCRPPSSEAEEIFDS